MERVDKLLNWLQPIVTVVSLAFGGGILYADVQDVKRTVQGAEGLKSQVDIMEVKLEATETAQKKTVDALEKVVDAVNKLNVTVGKLEAKIER